MKPNDTTAEKPQGGCLQLIIGIIALISIGICVSVLF